MFNPGQLFSGSQKSQDYDLQTQLENKESKIQQLQQFNQRLTYLLRTLSQGIFSMDLERKIDFWSHGMEVLLSVPTGQALGKKVEYIFPEIKELEYDPYSLLLEGERKIEFEFSRPIARQVSTEGEANAPKELAPFGVTFLPMKNDMGNLVGIAAEVRNLKERKNYEEMQLDFVSVVTHELRTPATSIKGYLSLLLDEGNNLTDEQKKFLRRAYISNERQIHTIESLLTVSRIEHEFLKPDVESAQLETVVADMVKFVREDANNKGLEIRLNYPQFSLPHVTADINYLKQIVYVLLSNAIKFTEKGHVEISFKDESGSVILSVEDTGAGIDKEMQNKVFDRFTRGERPFTEDTQGIGLGLYTAKAMVEKMNGQIWFESELGEGSTFYVALPQVQG